MFKFLLEPELLDQAIYSQRWSALVRADIDPASIASWDKNLDRKRRILVPVDVQAFVVDDENVEPVVPITGGANDPEPFADGEKLPRGIHLHWALPDALLRGGGSDDTELAANINSEVDSANEEAELLLPEIPDRWVVIRALFPEGLDRPLLRAWVIDALKGSTTPLEKYDGLTDDNPEAVSFERLDGAIGGSLLWTASYSASAGRLGFHDALDDLEELREIATNGFTNDVATYLVAGWCSDAEKDPLRASGSRVLFDILNDYGWHLDPEADPTAIDPDLPVIGRLEDVVQFERPVETVPTEVVVKDREERFNYADIFPASSSLIDKPSRSLIAQSPVSFSSLLHGMVTGVPVGSIPPNVDEKPSESALSLAIGLDTDDIVSALGSKTLGDEPEERRATEMLAAAFTSDLIDRLGSPDGMRDIAEREHSDSFQSIPGKPLPASRPDRLREADSTAINSGNVGRKGRGDFTQQSKESELNPAPQWRDKVTFSKEGSSPKAPVDPIKIQVTDVLKNQRLVVRPAPRLFRPQPPIISVRGAKPSLRHHHDGLFDDEDRLRCRFPTEVDHSITGVVDAAELLPTLGSGAIPDEVLLVMREALVLNPYCSRWLAASSAATDSEIASYTNRINAEMLRLFAPDGRYDGTGEYTLSSLSTTNANAPRAAVGDAWNTVSNATTIITRQVASELSVASVLGGTQPSPLGVTAWRQPWVPLWLEWRVELVGSDSLEDWELGDLDLQRKETSSTNQKAFEFTGRSPINRGLTTALHASIERWMLAEQERDATSETLDDDDLAALSELQDFIKPLDLASASLDGVREQLLGIQYIGGMSVDEENDDKPVANGPATTLFGGRMRVMELRLIDAFGRILKVPVDSAQTTSELEVEGISTAIALSPRLQHGGRWLLRFTDPGFAGDTSLAPEAFVDQLEPELSVNPVAGFVLPDHIDESLEAFDIQGNPLGQLSHHEITGAVRWEPAPGRAVPPGAGPLVDLIASAFPVGEMAAGIVKSDIRARDHDSPPEDSALTTVLRAIDTTLWTVDTFGALGTSSVAGLVGRPIAVVRATLTLDIPNDLEEVVVTATGGKAERVAAFDALKNFRYPVRLGDLQRSDDALLGFYVNDDYEKLHLVDKVVAANARDTGRLRGQLGLLGKVVIPQETPLSHPLIEVEDTLYVRPGETVSLTLLMLPAGRVHLTSGILPRKALSLSDAWINKGLQRLIPSVRVGPVLVDPDEIRLPKVNLLGEKQQFTRRTGPLSWRDDPIVSATQSALLPKMPHQIQEGWIRIVDETDNDS